MKKLLIIGFLLFSSAVLFAGEEAVKGEVVDLSCYITHGAHGEKHAECAKKCVEKGLPMGILTESGEVYLLIENHSKADAYAKAKEHAAKTITVKGAVAERGGMKAISVDEVETATD